MKRKYRNALGLKPTPISELLFVESKNGEIRYHTDVFYLLNMERLKDRIGEEAYIKYIKSLSPQKTPYRDSGLSDVDLLNSIKSKYLQSQSELRAYTQELMNTIDDKLLNAQQVKELKEQLEKSQRDYDLFVNALSGMSNSNSSGDVSR